MDNDSEDIIHISENDLPEETIDIVLTPEDIRKAASEYLRQNPNLEFNDFQDTKPDEQMKFYDRLRQSILNWAEGKGLGSKYLEYVLLAPDLFLLLVRLMMDPRVETTLRNRLLAIAAYFISPLDLMPEALLGPIGYTDDIVITAIGILSMIKDVDEEVIREHWSGKGDILVVLRKVSAAGEFMLGIPLWKLIKAKFGAGKPNDLAKNQ